jgi:hypothetical protein
MFLRRASLGFVLTAVLHTAVQSFSASNYGRGALSDILHYGVAVRVVCTGDLEQHREAFLEHVKKRLEGRGIGVHPEGSVVLKLVVTSIRSNDGFFVVHMRLQLDQAAHLASNNQLVDAPTWDAWKMGEYREDELLGVVDDLARQFLNDYIAAN